MIPKITRVVLEKQEMAIPRVIRVTRFKIDGCDQHFASEQDARDHLFREALDNFSVARGCPNLGQWLFRHHKDLRALMEEHLDEDERAIPA